MVGWEMHLFSECDVFRMHQCYMKWFSKTSDVFASNFLEEL